MGLLDEPVSPSMRRSRGADRAAFRPDFHGPRAVPGHRTVDPLEAVTREAIASSGRAVSAAPPEAQRVVDEWEAAKGRTIQRGTHPDRNRGGQFV